MPAAARGLAHVKLGGPDRDPFDVEAGDVLVLLAGPVHKNFEAGGDALVIGAYPEGQDGDTNTGRSGERPRTIEQVPRPAMGPVWRRRALGACWT